MANILALALVLIVIAVWGSADRVGAQSTPPSSSSSCTGPLVSLVPCLAFLQGGQNNTTPTSGCCTALASVVKTSAACLCQVLNATSNPLGITINQTRALALPGACKITTPPASQCKSTAVSSPPAAAPSSPTAKSPANSAALPPTAKSPANSAALPPTAKSPANSATLPPTTTPATGGALSPSTQEGPTASSPSTKEGPTVSGSAGSMMGVGMLIHVVAITGSLSSIISALSI